MLEQPTKFDMLVNLRTARTLGVTIPHSILLPAGTMWREGKAQTSIRAGRTRKEPS